MKAKVIPMNDRKPYLLASLIVALSMILAACATPAQPTQPASTPGAFQGEAAATSTTAPALPTAAATSAVVQPPATSAEAVIDVATDPTYEEILVDGEGMTLYIFTVDEPNQSNCDADCLANWPPLITLGNPTLGDRVEEELVGSTTLADGRQIVTYNSMPLYYFVEDTQPGDIKGQGVGNVWYVISRDGEVLTSASDDSTPAAPAAAATEPTIMVASNPTLGEFLVDDKGMSLYMFTRDTADMSNCSGDCLVKWPPLLTQGSPIAGTGVDASLLGSAPMPDGTFIVTYNHMPLYYWYQDLKPGDVLGQDVGGVWYVVSPQGEIIR
jgi:predicted lipoprotein with Yx(FWY)xxD motif